jgi:predicted acyltransferase
MVIMTQPTPLQTTPSQRLYSLDALRGFDMFWIMGGDELIRSIAKATGNSFWQTLADQMEHPAWNGLHFYDLIFPLFLFIAGVATPYSVGRAREKGTPRSELVMRVVRRGLVLVLLGIIYNNGLRLHPWSEIRYGSVLGRIGLAYMFANLIYLYTKKQRTQWIWFAGLLIGYWLLLAFNSAPGFPRGDLTMPGNFASYIDRSVMPGKLYLGIHDPEGLMSTIPAISTGLLGILAGQLLKNSPLSGAAKSVRLMLAGVVSILLALAWNMVFPINKNLWTSSFVLCVGGISLILLGLFYYIIDVRGHRKWAFFFTVIGMNSILIYLSGHFINWQYMTNGFFRWLVELSARAFGDPWSLVVFAICLLAVKWVFLYILYRKKIFLRV